MRSENVMISYKVLHLSSLRDGSPLVKDPLGGLCLRPILGGGFV